MSLRWFIEIYNTYLFICLLLHHICKLEQQKDYKLSFSSTITSIHCLYDLLKNTAYCYD